MATSTGPMRGLIDRRAPELLPRLLLRTAATAAAATQPLPSSRPSWISATGSASRKTTAPSMPSHGPVGCLLLLSAALAAPGRSPMPGSVFIANPTSGTPEAPTSAAPGTDCADPSWPRWRNLPKTHRLVLSAANVACAPDTETNRTQDEAPRTTLSISVQSMDDIQLALSEEWSANNATEPRLALQSLQGGYGQQPCLRDEALLLWEKPYHAPGLTVSPEILTPGSHALSVHLWGSAWLLNVSVAGRECWRSPSEAAGEAPCSGGACVLEPGAASFACRCCPGLSGRYCEERDGCFHRPCLNQGFCVDIAEGLAGSLFQCLCPHGFRGRRCEEKLGACELRPCPPGTHCVQLSDGTNRSCVAGRLISAEASTTPSTTVQQPLQGQTQQPDLQEQHPGTVEHLQQQAVTASDQQPGQDKPDPSNEQRLQPQSEQQEQAAGMSTNSTGTNTSTIATAEAAGSTAGNTSACSAHPCVHGNCEDLPATAASGAGGFRCYCLPGYGGDLCEFEYDECDSGPCAHNAHCEDLVAGFRCHCSPGYVGRRCELRLDFTQGQTQQPEPPQQQAGPLEQLQKQAVTASRQPQPNEYGNQQSQRPEAGQQERAVSTITYRTSTIPTPTASAELSSPVGNVSACGARPCVHGKCEDLPASAAGGAGGFRCYCLPGYGGDLCEFEYDECDSGPCAHGSQCEDLVAGFRCHCGPGYAGRRCEVKVDLCRPNPCPPPAQCLDRGNNYSCLCRPGYEGPGCTQRYDPCFPNPCQNGGSCWPSLDSFYCSCARGFIGDTCEATRQPPTADARTQSRPADQLHNIYIAAATLAGACLIVLAVVTVCHCRVHHSYRGCVRRLGRSCAQLKQRTLEDPDKSWLNPDGSVSEGSAEWTPAAAGPQVPLIR
ncbi:uncharacterized protein LOC144170612 isoform X1 [Haemaphysalis longicornis]